VKVTDRISKECLCAKERVSLQACKLWSIALNYPQPFRPAKQRFLASLAPIAFGFMARCVKSSHLAIPLWGGNFGPRGTPGGAPIKTVQKSAASARGRAYFARQLPSRLMFSAPTFAATFGLLGIFKLVQKSKSAKLPPSAERQRYRTTDRSARKGRSRCQRAAAQRG
jgi:hypothetical protein